MGIAGDWWGGPIWEPKTPEDEERIRQGMEEVQERVRIPERLREARRVGAISGKNESRAIGKQELPCG
jgi:hypothetical protein